MRVRVPMQVLVPVAVDMRVTVHQFAVPVRVVVAVFVRVRMLMVMLVVVHTLLIQVTVLPRRRWLVAVGMIVPEPFAESHQDTSVKWMLENSA